jgi:glucose-6-phosphate 1-dehydrogenase
MSDEEWAKFADGLEYVPVTAGPEALAAAVKAAEEKLGPDACRLHYLSVPPKAAQAVIVMLRDADLVDRARVVMEKPFGDDLDSAIKLNDFVHETFDESQIFRIDHFLGKEAALNILAFRFANGLFEPIWNRNFIDHVQIDIPETLGLDQRANFYESTGAYKDMVVTHLMQVMAFVAMEPPTALEPRAISEEKNKVFRSMLPIDTRKVVRGQYGGYREEPGCGRDSDTETFIALGVDIDNWRWAGVPFYLRTGKRLARKVTEIAVTLKPVPHLAFQIHGAPPPPNQLVFTIQPNEGVSISLGAKIPGAKTRIRPVNMQFQYGTSFTSESPEAYERLILDVMRGDATLFTRVDEVEALWSIVDPVLAFWAADPAKPAQYPAGSSGPAEADALMTGRAKWRPL